MTPSYDLPENTLEKGLRRARWLVRSIRPARPVRRNVQGVDLVLPWSHRLPDYAAAVPEYGQNLVRLAVELGSHESPVTMIDVGANVGDSAAQVTHATESLVLCVEADDFYIRFLRSNVAHDPRIHVERALLSASEDGAGMAPVRRGGTTRFEPGRSTATAPLITASELRRKHPEFDRVRLVKSDTDGHDVVLIPALARAWRDHVPVLFFEFDPRLTATAGNDLDAVWTSLAELGYAQVAAWDNFGRPVHNFSLTEAADWSARMETEQPRKAYWDVAVVHRDDSAGKAAVDTVYAASPA